MCFWQSMRDVSERIDVSSTMLAAYIYDSGEIFHPCKVSITDILFLFMYISTAFSDILKFQIIRTKQICQ